jgi:hypothetical protein
MTVKEWIEREKYVAIHGQTLRFRIVKYLILVAIAGSLYAWNGWTAVGMVFLTLFIVAIAVHFFFRWKTKGWTESWGPYKKLDVPSSGRRDAPRSN